MMTESTAIIDACSLINFYASTFLESILKNSTVNFCIVEQVKNESLYIRKPDESERGFDYEPINLDQYFKSNLLKGVSLEKESEKNLFINLAAQLDDGEAATLAIAVSRKMRVITDDKKAIRILRQDFLSVHYSTTLDIIKEWCDRNLIEKDELEKALNNILIRANYLPPKKHHLFNWWKSILESN
jgi:predicted nucleic acid-binding protein